jgi:hypothetical protein
MDTVGNIEKAILAQLGNPDSPLIRRVTRNNQILLHNYSAEVIKHCRCALDGCNEAFGIVLVPNQVLYPKYCRDHRTEFRREFHLQQRAAVEVVPHPSTALKVQDAFSPA